MKFSKIIAIALLLIAFTNNISAQEISPMLFGQNSWMPDSTGTRFLNGHVHKKWPDIQGSGAQSIRFGGIASDMDMPTNYQYIRMIDSIRTRGMEPIIQVSYWGGRYSAEQAAELVKFINKTSGKNIKYWSIGNEPDHGSSYKYTKADQVAPYIRDFSRAMKNVDPTIKIIGPDCAWYNKQMIPALTTPNGPHDITGKSPEGHFYVDIISFHEYPFKGQQTREKVISNLTDNGNFEWKLTDLKSKLENCNKTHGRTGENALKMAITEANIGYQDPSSNGVTGLGTESFIGGQFWVEMMGLSIKHEVFSINFWAVTNALGFISKQNEKRPTYYHFKMMADNFKGSYADAKTNLKDVKAFASKDGNQVAVMVMNQSASKNQKFSLKFSTSSIEGDNPLKINIDAGIENVYVDEIANQSTLLLVFDASGNIIKKCEYTQDYHAVKNIPPTCTNVNPPAAQITAPSTVICDDGELLMAVNELEGYSYQWNRDGDKIEGATGINYIAKTPGIYTVSLSSDDDIIMTDAFEVQSSDGTTAEITADGPTNICHTLAVTLRANEGPEFTYTWKLNEVDIPEAKSPEYEVTVPGDYTVYISNPCGEATSETVIVTGCDGVAQAMALEVEGKPLLHTYPNPTNGYFTVEMKTDSLLLPGELVTIEILNVAGQVVFAQQPHQVNGYVRQIISMDSSYPPGLYIIRIRAGKESFSNKVMIAR
ncbi:MAG: T9SS type A sorting domain-containing protein [Bacteroidetes bacterium]|nr:T9SS type A sorting domain-containing protein [Bacteroidota bacterium]